MKESQAWRLQAQSDFEMAMSIFKKDDANTYCHTVAKYQQSVEKHIKGIYAVLEERGAILPESRPMERGHTLDKTPKQLKLLMFSTNSNRIGVARNLRDLLPEHFMFEAVELCRLAPSYPKKGDLFSRNTEYPFNQLQETAWTAPCADGAFSLSETQRFGNVAGHFYRGIDPFLKTLRVTKRSDSE